MGSEMCIRDRRWPGLCGLWWLLLRGLRFGASELRLSGGALQATPGSQLVVEVYWSARQRSQAVRRIYVAMRDVLIRAP